MELSKDCDLPGFAPNGYQSKLKEEPKQSGLERNAEKYKPVSGSQ